jgi:hypothetical protein
VKYDLKFRCVFVPFASHLLNIHYLPGIYLFLDLILWVTSIVAKFADFQKYDRFFVLQVCHLHQTFKPTAESCIFVHIILQECKM